MNRTLDKSLRNEHKDIVYVAFYFTHHVANLLDISHTAQVRSFKQMPTNPYIINVWRPVIYFQEKSSSI